MRHIHPIYKRDRTPDKLFPLFCCSKYFSFPRNIIILVVVHCCCRPCYERHQISWGNFAYCSLARTRYTIAFVLVVLLLLLLLYLLNMIYFVLVLPLSLFLPCLVRPGSNRIATFPGAGGVTDTRPHTPKLMFSRQARVTRACSSMYLVRYNEPRRMYYNTVLFVVGTTVRIIFIIIIQDVRLEWRGTSTVHGTDRIITHTEWSSSLLVL